MNYDKHTNEWEKIKHKFEGCGGNVYARALTAYNKINDHKYKKIMCSVSGGADSDIMLDWLHAMDYDKKVTYVFFDTGLEYKATKKHLEKLEQKYGIEIKRIKAIKSIPQSCKEYGIPFLTKKVSQNIQALQRHNFDFVNDGPLEYEELAKKYPKIKSILKWWCNLYESPDGGRSRFNINVHKLLKEFMIAYPPDFKISDKCCKYTKKDVAKNELKNGYGLNCIGVRRAEGGVRAARVKNCFTLNNDKGYDDFRPLFFITDKDKEAYKIHNGINYSDCYEIYGFKRTGCAGCPFNSKFEDDLKIIKVYEPEIYKACLNVFGKSYEYTRKYRQFKNEFNKENANDELNA